MSSESNSSLRNDAALAAKGLCMGCADVVPGVSGGTVALILGIYERLIRAISHIDRRFAGLVWKRQWRDAAQHIDFRFLLALTTGILSGFVVMTVVMNRLLTDPNLRMLTLAAFFGMILASTFIVGKWIAAKSKRELGMAVAFVAMGAAVAVAISLIPQGDAQVKWEPSLGYVFICGSIGICAMILPGISGAMLLLILGVYVHLTEIPRNILHGEQVMAGAVTMGVFATGCLVTLIFFSKILRWLLEVHRQPTMATLTGVMIGALVKVWPYQRDLSPHIEKVKYKRFAAEWPANWEAVHFTALLVVVSAAVLILLIDRWSSQGRNKNA